MSDPAPMSSPESGLRARLATLRSLALPTGIGVLLVLLAAFTIQVSGEGEQLADAFRRLLRQDRSAVVPLLATAVLAPAIAFLLWRRPSGLAWLTEHPRSVAAATSLSCLLLAVFAFQGQPLAMDEVAPLFQARVFASGHLSAAFQPDQLRWLFNPRFLGSFFFVQQATGHVVSAYWPGMALLLLPFEALGCAWALNPLLAGGSVLLLRFVALQFTAGDRDASGAAVALLLASPTFLINGASFYSMNAHLFANLAFVALLLQPTRRRLVAAGAVGGFALALNNPLPHLLFAWPWWGLQLLGRDRVRRVVALALGYLPVALLLVVGWFVFSESLREAGAPVVGGSALSRPGLGQLVVRALGFAKLVLWSPLVLLPLAALGALRQWANPRVRCLVLSALSTLLAYFAVRFDQGHGWGYRYFHPAYASLPLLACCYLVGQAASAREPLLRATLAWALLGLLLVLPQRAAQVSSIVAEHRGQLVATPAGLECVHFVHPSRANAEDLITNDPRLRGDLHLFHHGDTEVAAFRQRYFPLAKQAGENATDTAYCGSLAQYRAAALAGVGSAP